MSRLSKASWMGYAKKRTKTVNQPVASTCMRLCNHNWALCMNCHEFKLVVQTQTKQIDPVLYDMDEGVRSMWIESGSSVERPIKQRGCIQRYNQVFFQNLGQGRENCQYMVRWWRGNESELREGNAPSHLKAAPTTTLQVVRSKNTVLRMISQYHVQYLNISTI